MIHPAHSGAGDRGAAAVLAAAGAAVATAVIWAVAQFGVGLIAESRADRAADALALAAVVWQGADLGGLAARNGVELLEVNLEGSSDPFVDLEVVTAEVVVRYRGAVASARAMARDVPLPTLVP